MTNLTYLMSLPLFLLATTNLAVADCDIEKDSRLRWGNIKGNAGCLIIENKKMVLVSHRENDGHVGPPGGTANPDEIAACTAAREVKEETGLDVTVGELIHNFNNKFYFFSCTAKLPANKPKPIKLTPSDTKEVSEAFWADPASFPQDKWRFPKQRGLVIEMFKMATES